MGFHGVFGIKPPRPASDSGLSVMMRGSVIPMPRRLAFGDFLQKEKQAGASGQIGLASVHAALG